MPIIFGPILAWIFRTIVVKFVVFAIVFTLLALLIPYVVGLLTGYTGTGNLTTAFLSIPSGVWWILDLTRIDFGAPTVIGAYVTRFLIRRVPFLN